MARGKRVTGVSEDVTDAVTPATAPYTKLTDEDFIQQYVAAGKNQTMLASRLGVARLTVIRRLKRLNLTDSDEKAAGRAAVVVQAELQHHVAKDFDQSVQHSISEMRSLAKLGGILSSIEENLEFITQELRAESAANPGKRKLQPHLLKLLVQLTRESRGIITDIVSIKKDLFQVKGTAAFMEAMIQVHLKYDPDIRRKLFIELSRFGTGEQVFGLGEEQRSGTE